MQADFLGKHKRNLQHSDINVTKGGQGQKSWLCHRQTKHKQTALTNHHGRRQEVLGLTRENGKDSLAFEKYPLTPNQVRICYDNESTDFLSW